MWHGEDCMLNSGKSSNFFQQSAKLIASATLSLRMSDVSECDNALCMDGLETPKTYRRLGFDCEILLITNFKFFSKSQSTESQEYDIHMQSI